MRGEGGRWEASWAADGPSEGDRAAGERRPGARGRKRCGPGNGCWAAGRRERRAAREKKQAHEGGGGEGQAFCGWAGFSSLFPFPFLFLFQTTQLYLISNEI
jgi:hypothetical protein